MSELLARVPGIVTAPADPDAVAVADALVPGGLPPALRDFLALCDGARVGEVEIFGAARITERATDTADRWKTAPDTVVIGTAGPGRALVMSGERSVVHEVDDDPWDDRTARETADTPLELFTVHRGLPLRDRGDWWAVPGLGEALSVVRVSLRADLAALGQTTLGAAAGAPLPSVPVGFTAVDAATAEKLLTSAGWESFLLNYRPEPPVPGTSAQVQWLLACDALLEPDHSRLLDAARRTPTAPGLVTPDTVREFAFLAAVAKAREDLAATVSEHGTAGTPADTPGRRLTAVHLAGHVPVSLGQAY